MRPVCHVTCVDTQCLFFIPGAVDQAQLQRGNLLLKQGRLDEAESDFKSVVSTDCTCSCTSVPRTSAGSPIQIWPEGVSVDLWWDVEENYYLFIYLNAGYTY